MKYTSITLLVLVVLVGQLIAQPTYPQDGIYDERNRHHAFTNATIHVSPTQTLENATLIIKEGKVVAVGKSVKTPKDAVVHDLTGKHIYASFIELFSSYGMPESKAIGNRPRMQPQMYSNKEGAYHWNEAIKPEFEAHRAFVTNEKSADALRKSGFGVSLSHLQDGMSRGSGTLVLLGAGRENEVILEEKTAHFLSTNKGKSTQNYPSSLMGGIALFKQTYHDAAWYATQKNKEKNTSLAAWNDLQSLPQIFEVRDRLEVLRMAKLGKEFGVKYLFKGAGDEYQRLDAMKALGSAFILPLDFPDAFDVEDPFDAMQVSLSEMKHWELAPSNPARLAAANIPFAITSHGLSGKQSLLQNLRKAIEAGLSEEDALAALTTTPARLIGADTYLGTLEKGKYANFLITNKPIFEKGSTLHYNWIDGIEYELKAFEEVLPLGNGVYNLQFGNKNYSLEVNRKAKNPKLTLRKNFKDTLDIKINHNFSNDVLFLSFKDDEAMVRLSGTASATSAQGKGQTGTGDWIDWSLSPTRALPTEEKKKGDNNEKSIDDNKKDELTSITYPFLGYGWETAPKQQTFLIKNITVWTNEEEGILEETDVILQNGKISQIGKNLSMRGATVIDGTGKHLTPGIIDEHSHIAISRGVNEGTQVSSAEVSIADVVNSEDINIYRYLAGGVTAAQLLHGSANPIGGQSALIKMRWGALPEDMKIKNADGFIKFALGENVKQSNWGDNYRIRFPQTRMGVEQVYEDYFTRAAEYKKLKQSGKPYRKDLDLETIQEILDKKRFITCHSYVQSEINMLMKVAERHGFVLNTFTHILEGYKLADKMAAHGAGGSTFSDWWAYKYEVRDAIPQNAYLMMKQGVTVAINSDDAEMARRLNQEAAKSIMYMDMPEEDALKMVTLNPAKLLHLDNRMGSIKVGKDADVVIWTDHPLSIYAKADKTFIDGVKYYDAIVDKQLRTEIKKERSRLIQKMLKDKKAGKPTQKAHHHHHHHYHCDDIEDEMAE